MTDFTYKVNDGILDSNIATVKININALSNSNHPPVTVNDKATTYENSSVNINVLANDSDVDHDPLSITAITTQPKNGTAIINANNNTITYTPSTNFFGQDTFAYRVSDGHPDGTATANVTVTVNHVNHPPVTNAGLDQIVNENTTDLKLNGTGSSDPDKGDTITSFSWKQISGSPTVSLAGANTATPTFTAPSVTADTTLKFNLTVTDNHGAISKPDTVSITVKNANIPPVAYAGTNQTVNENTTGVTLNASKSYDRDGKIVSYLWKQTSGPSASLSNPNSVSTTFTAPSVTANTTLTFRLTVTDNGGANNNATTSVLVKNVNIPPRANSGSNQTVDGGALVTLDGTKSNDPDGGSVASYLWTQTSGPAVTLSAANTAKATFTSPTSTTSNITLTFKLTVKDSDGGAASSASTTVLVKRTNVPPIANAGSNQTVNENTTGVKLDGTKSNDPDGGKIASYNSGTELTGPSVTLTGVIQRRPYLPAPHVTRDTTLTFKLTVTDNDGGATSSAST